MSPTREKKEYFLYARKSSESDERQIQSIDDQTELMQKQAKELDLTIKRVFTEAKSAKEPGIREVFEGMLSRIEKGEASGILTWKIDRLSRNPIDSARIQWLLQKGRIQSIQTSDREYLPEDNALIFSIESSMANQYIRDLSKNVKRGLHSKLEKGWRPGPAPEGYRNTKLGDRGENTILVDQKRFTELRWAWDMMLTGDYTVDALLDKLNDRGFRTRRRKKLGGKPLSRSGLYRILTNSFYMGVIEYGGKTVPGRHTPIVTPEEFEEVQRLLGRPFRPKRKSHLHTFPGMLSCGECGGPISATLKEKKLKSTSEEKKYELYYCIPARKKKGCTQRNYVNVSVLHEKLQGLLETHTLHPTIFSWLLKILEREEGNEDERFSERRAVLEETKTKLAQELGTLRTMRIKEQVTDVEYESERKKLQAEEAKVATALKNLKAGDLSAGIERILRFSVSASQNFEEGGQEKRREIASSLRWNWTMKDRNVLLQSPPWLVPLSKESHSMQALLEALEPENHRSTQSPQGIPESLRPTLRTILNRIRTGIQEDTGCLRRLFDSP